MFKNLLNIISFGINLFKKAKWAKRKVKDAETEEELEKIIDGDSSNKSNNSSKSNS